VYGELQLLEVIGISLVWIIIHEKSFYLHHIQRVQASKCKISPSCKGGALPVASRKMRRKRTVFNILFTEDAGFARGGIVSFLNTSV
jgi:hypothetical protein